MQTTEYNTRTHPVLQNTDNRNTVNFGITTKCSMKCPNCTVNVPGILKAGEARHYPLSDCIDAAYQMMWLRRIHITGGEPTLHPDFSTVCKSIKSVARPQFLTLETNGFAVLVHLQEGWLQKTFDLVFITHYEKDAVYPGSPDNTEVILKARDLLGNKLIVEPPVRHLPKHETIRLGIKHQKVVDDHKDICSKFDVPGLPAAFYNGKMYSCCVSFGIDESLGREIDYYWRNWITELPMGCASCSFRGT